MSRPLRIDYHGAWHHVMNRARRGHVLYHDNEDHELVLSLLRLVRYIHKNPVKAVVTK